MALSCAGRDDDVTFRDTRRIEKGVLFGRAPRWQGTGHALRIEAVLFDKKFT